jgi:hypothetical protein
MTEAPKGQWYISIDGKKWAFLETCIAWNNWITNNKKEKR